MGCASVAYKLRAVAVRSSFSQNLQAKIPVFILRSLTSEALEYQQTIDIENTWPEKLMYAIMLPHKAWAAGDTLTAIVKVSPLAKGVYVKAIDSAIVETTKIITRGGNREYTRVVASARHEMIVDHKAVDVASPNSAASNTSPSGTLATGSPRTSRPASPHFGSSSSNNPPQQQEEEDLEFESNDIVTNINLSIPRSSAYPFLYSASSPTTTPTQSSAPSPTLQHAPLPLSTNPSTSQPTTSPTNPSLPSHPTITPSHNLEPIFISHRIKWIMFIHNKDGHVSELRCSLPIKILDGALLDESRGFTMRFRRLLLRTSGLRNVSSRSGEEGNEGEGNERAGVDGEEGRIRQMEVDRELPSYPAHVRDRVANMFLSDTVTELVSNPWVGNIGPSGPASGRGASALNTPELSGQRGSSNIPSPLIPPAVSPRDSDPATLHTQPDSRASRSGDSTPDIQSSQQQAHLMSNLLVNEAVRRIGDVPSSVGGQQQQSPPHQHQHQTHDQQQPQQHSRTLRWGSRVGSRVGSRASSPERIAISSVTTNNNDNNGSSSVSEGGVYGSPSTVVSSSSSPGPGFASPFQNLFKATIKPLTALAGHRGHGRPTHSLSRSTTSLTGLRSSSTSGTASDLSADATTTTTTTNSNSDQSSALLRSELYLSLTCLSSGGASQNFSSTSSPSPQNEMTNGFISDNWPPSPSPAAANGMTAPSLSSSSDSSGLESTTSSHTASESPLSRTISRAFSLVPDYSIASRGFIGGIPPLSSMRGLPSYEEAEAQRKERETAEIQSQMTQTRLPIKNQGQTATQAQTQTQPQNQVVDKTKKMKMKERGSMSEPDLVGRFGHIGVRFESGIQAVTETEVSMQSDTSSGVGIVQRLQDADDDEDDDGNEDDMGTGPIQMRISRK